jgi:hypothetical protein
MEDLEKVVKNGVLTYVNNNLVIPVMEAFFKYHDERKFRLFTKDLADLFEECLPEYFETDYHSRIGQFYYSDLYAEYVPEEMLIEIVKTPDHESFEGLRIYFAYYGALDLSSEHTVNEMTIKFDYMDELIQVIILHHLNQKNVNT